MTTPGLTDEGFIALRAADYLKRIRTSYETSVGITLDWERERVLGNLTAIMAQMLGELSSASQGLYDAFDVNNATGVMLENLCALVGIEREEATFSAVELTLTGDEGTIIPAGYVVEGGGESGKARWETTEDTEIEEGGTATVLAQALVAGTTEAAPGEITTIVTPLDGWDEVTNVSSAFPGLARESDDALRTRRKASLQISRGNSLNAIRAALLALDTVVSAEVLENDTNKTITIDGRSLVPHSIRPVLWTGSENPVLTDAQLKVIATTLYHRLPMGVSSVGDDVTVTISGAGMLDKKIRWDWATPREVAVGMTLTLEEGYELEDVEDAIQAALELYFDTLLVGSAARILAVYALLYTIEGVRTAAITLDGGGVDITPLASEMLQLGTPSISVS